MRQGHGEHHLATDRRTPHSLASACRVPGGRSCPADNIANVNTPGFLAGRTDFESALSGALRNGEAPTISGGTVVRSLEPTNTNGNNVNLDSETVIATETGLRYQLALNALDGKYSLLRTSLRTA
jgi:flagellar basal-body rod protein FlgB